VIRAQRGVLAARLATAAVLIAGLLAALFLLPSFWLKCVIGAVLGVAAFEWGRLCRIGAVPYAVLTVAAYGIVVWTGQGEMLLALGAAFWVAIVPFWLWRGVQARHAMLLAAAGFGVLIPAGMAVVTMPAPQVLLVLGLTWVADTAAYFIGSRFGRRKLAPSISPSKTWEGAAGALLGALSYAIICAVFVPQLGARFSAVQWAVYLAGAVVLCAASIVGDLFESAAKRQAGVKDSGATLPGHGGILDRIDSATSTLPLAAVLSPLILGAQ
jgi:phosphatidate cytidylyltransferase